MKIAIRILVIVCLLACSLFVLVTPASADDNITFAVHFNTQTAGPRGGTIHINISFFNNTAKEIDWVDININTQEPFTERWTGTDGIPPYCRRSAYIDVFFAPEDLDKDKFLQLAINYDSDANPDDVKMETFRINSIDEVISINASSDPEHGPYLSGDSVFVTHRITNNADMAVEDIVMQCVLTNERGTRIADTGPITRSDLDPGALIGIPIGTELTNSDLDYVEASYALAYTHLGIRYAVSDVTITLPIIHPDFSAELSAPFYSADIDAVTDLNLEITNTGNQGFGSFYIENPEGIHIVNGDSLGVGETMNISIPFLFYEYGSWNIRYIVTGDYGYGEHSVETNTIRMVCEAAPTPSPTQSLSPSSTAVAATTAIPSPTQSELEQAAQTSEPAAASTEQQEQQSSNLWLYIIIAILALFIIAAIIIIIVIVNKKSVSKRKDTL